MSLDLQLTTEQARRQIEAMDSAVLKLEATLNKVASSSTAFENYAKRIASFQGISPGAISSINNLSSALKNISSSGGINSLSSALNALNNVNVGKTAASVKALSSALSGLTAPAGLGRIAADLNSIGNAAQAASTKIAQLSSAMKGVNGSSINGAASSFNNFGNAARNAGTSVQGFGIHVNKTQALLNSLGIALTAVGFKNFIQGAVEADRAVVGFGAQMQAIGMNSEQASERLDKVNSIATSLALPLSDARAGFAKLSVAMQSTGYSTAEVDKTFQGFATTFRTMGLSTEQMKRGFNALSQIFSKGTVSAEELKQQLGEIIPAFPMLAESMGITGKELSKALEGGKVGVEEILKLAVQMEQKFAAGLPASLATLSAAFQMLSNSATLALEKIGAGLGVAAPSVRALADALKSEGFLRFSQIIGEVAGTIGGALASALTAVVNLIASLSAETQRFLAWGLAGVLAGITAAAVGMVGAFVAAASGFSTLTLGIVAAGVAIAGFVSQSTTLQSILGFLVEFLGAIVEGVVWLGSQLLELVKWVGATVDSFAKWLGVFQPVTEAVLDLGGSLETTNGPLEKQAGYVENLSHAFQYGAQSAGSMDDSVSKLGGSTRDTNSNLSQGKSAADGYGRGISDARGQVLNFASSLNGMRANLSDTVSVFGEGTTAAEAFGDGNNYVSTSLENASSSMSSASSYADSLASSYDNAAASASSLAAAQSSIGTGGGGGGGGGNTGGGADFGSSSDTFFSDGSGAFDSFTFDGTIGGNLKDSFFDSFSGGGISHKGSGRRVRANPAIFSGAPSYAGGTPNSSGGIPAILHANEAVVPLTGGGAIPIETVGGGSSSGGNGVSSFSKSVKSTLDQMLVVQKANTELFSVKLDKLILTVEKVGTSLTSINAGAGSTGGTSTGTGTSVSTGTGVSLGGSGTISGVDSDGNTFTFSPKQPSSSTTATPSASAAGAATTPSGGAMSTSDILKEYAKNPNKGGAGDIDYQDGQWYKLGSKGYFRYTEGKGFFDAKKGFYFDQGTPNTSKDLFGSGAPAVLHRDEAVIPLPDGRAVPVDMGNFSPNTGGSTSNKVEININFSVTAKDAESFKASEDQMMAKLQSSIAKAVEKVGILPKTDDPTSRRS